MSQIQETKEMQETLDQIHPETNQTQAEKYEAFDKVFERRERLIRAKASILYHKAELGERIVMHPLFYDFVQLKLKTDGSQAKVSFNSNGWVGYNGARCIVANSFSFQMLDGLGHDVHVCPIPEALLPARSIMNSYVGHSDTAAVIGVPCKRGNLQLRKGDILFVAQLIGGRLPEGCTKLPEGFQIKWYYVTID